MTDGEGNLFLESGENDTWFLFAEMLIKSCTKTRKLAVDQKSGRPPIRRMLILYHTFKLDKVKSPLKNIYTKNPQTNQQNHKETEEEGRARAERCKWNTDVTNRTVCPLLQLPPLLHWRW